MNKPLRLTGGVGLLLAGLVCVVWATVGVYQSVPVETSQRVDVRSEGEAEEPFEELAATESADSPAGSVGQSEPDERDAASPRGRTDQAVPPRGKDAAKSEAWGLWLTLVLILFLLVVAGGMLIVRRVRPKPMTHSKPTDTTDLWQEAGRRMKL